MNRHVVIGVYLGFWAAVAAVVVYIALVIGVQWWQAVLFAFCLFFVVNGSMAYLSMKRRLEATGERPPPYLVYLFFPRGSKQLGAQFQKSVAVPRMARVVLGAPIFVGGLILSAFVVIFSAAGPRAQTLEFVVAFVTVFFGVLGLLFLYVGFRLMVMPDDEPLFKRPWQRGDM
jgi:hypothetical protein